MAAGLDLVARKSLEGGREASILISSSSFFNIHNRAEETKSRQDFWSWNRLKDQFCIKNAELLFDKYQCRLQHTLFMSALLVNVVSGISAVVIRWFSSQSPQWDTNMIMKCATALSSLVIYIMAYQEAWFLSCTARLLAAIVTTIITVMAESGSSIIKLIFRSSPGFRFSSYPLLVVSAFLPYPRWSQVVFSTFAVALLELALSTISNCRHGLVSWPQIISDILLNFAVGLVGMYIRFLVEFKNRRAFLDRRECFENKFYLQYEKEQEERLLLSVLPKHISVQVREGIREVIRRLDQAPVPQRPFTELFVEKHRNVSILYADIVNSVALTASLNVSDLVETLNELFGRFDDSAERNCCLRIKLLGDCYYCVSGVPDRDPLHADHCVQMGLDMIEIIRAFREESHVNVDMRIGVHSGNVLSGLLGLRKWQFDIWSRDVTIASRMEQSGHPGCVHASRATKDLLQCDYIIEPVNGNIRDECLERCNMETFFIKPARKLPVKRESLFLPAEKGPHMVRQSLGRMTRRHSAAAEVLSSRRRTVLGFSLLQFRLMLSQVNEFMESAIESMALNNRDQWIRSEGIQPFLLTFRDSSLEKPFVLLRDPLFRYSLIGAFFVLCILTTVSALTKPSFPYFWVTCGFAIAICVVSLFCFWITFVSVKLKKSLEPHVARVFHLATGNVFVRVTTFLLVCVFLFLVAVMGMENCSSPLPGKYVELTSNRTMLPEGYIACEHPSYFLWCAVLSMTTVSLFLRIHFLMKSLVCGGLVAAYCLILQGKNKILGNAQLEDWSGSQGGVEHYWCLGVTWLLLHLLDRQVEYIGRLDYIWKRKLRLEQEESSFMGLVNKTLLRNILPEHVAKYYLNKESMHLDLDLYHEEYTSVAVMFASIPNYMDFYSESMFNDEGRKCLQVLHEIICGFDKLMYEPQFLKLEKIKTIGSTYMAAAGLQPGRNSSRTSCESSEPREDAAQNVMVLTKFALAMNETLNDINKNSGHDFKLRIGIAVGPVLAGVVGASKPQYDIWGDTVNIASRMDTTGVIGKIQATEAAAAILKESSKYEVKCRGRTFIKGKGWMTTYLVGHSEVTKL